MISMRPTNTGMGMIVRYMTRAPERHEVRTRLYQRIVEILRAKQGTGGGEVSTPRQLTTG